MYIFPLLYVVPKLYKHERTNWRQQPMKRKKSDLQKSGKISPKIIHEQTNFSYDVFPVTTSMLVVVVSLIFYLIWSNISQNQALYWFVVAISIIVIRVAVYWAYKNSEHKSTGNFWRNAFHVGAFASALLIFVTSFVYFTRLNITGQMVFTVLSLGIASGALPVLATDLKSYSIYVLLNTSPIALMNLTNPDISIKLMGAVTILYICMLMMAAYLFRRSILDSMIYRYRSDQLAERLKVANDRLSIVNRELHQMSTTDELTGTFNRRYFNQRFNEIWADHIRENQNLAGLMIDVDHFKPYNDIYGHLQGDHCLKKISAEIAGVIHRPRDFVSRFGGEEFILLLPATQIEGAIRIAEQIHLRIRELNIPHRAEGTEDRITVSIGGAAASPRKDSDPEDFLREIDRALYQAKHQGRNTSVFL